MTTRGHTSVMAQQSDEERSKGLFPTPPWATRALIEEVLRPVCGEIHANSIYDRTINPYFETQTVWEPACGQGHMSVPLAESFEQVFSTDIEDYGYGDGTLDFTFATAEDAPFAVDWVITNPPFPLAEDFLLQALKIARAGVAILARLQWLESESRYQVIWDGNAPRFVCPFSERVPMIEGVWDPEAASATAYCWFVWFVGWPPKLIEMRHIPPGQAKRRTKTSDLALATPGEAARRKKARKAKAAGGPDLLGGGDG